MAWTLAQIIFTIVAIVFVGGALYYLHKGAKNDHAAEEKKRETPPPQPSPETGAVQPQVVSQAENNTNK